MSSPIKTKLAQPVPELPVADVEKAQTYYRDILGFDVAWIYPDKSIGAVGRDGIAIFLSKQNNISPNAHWIFAVDIDATYQEMKLRNANITEEIDDRPWRLRQFTIEDLDGNKFTFHHDL
jgi:catechol 2,3-dioxygenase-like lactoylglutathione lyase family enzyme